MSQTPSEKKRRDLRWFGAYFRGTNELVSNFNRYLFFNADSSFHLEHAGRGKFISEALGRIALGPAAMDLWGRMDEFYKEFATQAAQLERQTKKVSSEVAKAKVEVERLKKLEIASEKKLKALCNAMEKAGWRKLPKNLNDFEENISSDVVDVYQRTDCFEKLDLHIVSVSLAKKTQKELIHRIEQAQELNKQLLRVRRNREKLDASIDDSQKLLAQLGRLRAYITAEWSIAYRQVKLLDNQIQRNVAAVERLDTIDAKFSETEKRKTLRELKESVSREIKKTTAEVTTRKAVLQEQQRRLSVLEHILAEAAALGQRMIEYDPNASECPLCGQEFQPPQFQERVLDRQRQQGQTTTVTSASLQSITQLEGVVQIQLKRRDALSLYIDFEREMHGTNNLPDSLTLAAIQAFENETRNELVPMKKRAEQMHATLKRLGAEGFNAREYNELVSEFFGSHAADDDKKIALKLEASRNRAKEKLNAERKSLSQQKNTERAIEDKLTTVLQRSIRGDGYDKAIQSLDEKQQILTSVIAAVVEVAHIVKISESEDLREKRRGISVVHDIANEMSESISVERARIATVTKLEERYKQLLSEEATLRARCGRAADAKTSFERLFKELSLDRVAAQFVDANRPRISSILNAIHAPREFSGIAPLEEHGQKLSLRLVRMHGHNKYAELSEISAGQRAAVALSVFLALNEKVKTAPPIILMDDPVSHVDDLNMLAFLDVMREIVATGKRQLFFATASKKMAGIFEQKFQGFGEDFKNIPLQRDV